jgi:hypothetical protein
MVSTLNQDYSTSFAENQSVLGSQQAKLNYIASNPMGYSPQQLATATTAINENTATAAKQAMGAAAAYAGAHGGADTGSGVAGELAGQIASGAAQSKAQQLASLSEQNQGMKQKNFWNAISGLNSVGSEYGGSGATAIGGANSAASTSTGAGSGALNAQQAGWSDLGGVISGIGGLATAASGFNFGGGAAASGMGAVNDVPLSSSPYASVPNFG